MACLKEETVNKLISDNDLTWPRDNFGGWNVGEQALQQRLHTKIAEQLRCRVLNESELAMVRVLRNNIEAPITGITGSALKRTMSTSTDFLL